MIKGQRVIKDTDKVDVKYVCDYCTYKFIQVVRKTKNQSDSVQCPNCKNFIGTWS